MSEAWFEGGFQYPLATIQLFKVLQLACMWMSQNQGFPSLQRKLMKIHVHSMYTKRRSVVNSRSYSWYQLVIFHLQKNRLNGETRKQEMKLFRWPLFKKYLIPKMGVIQIFNSILHMTHHIYGIGQLIQLVFWVIWGQVITCDAERQPGINLRKSNLSRNTASVCSHFPVRCQTRDCST